MRMGSDLGKLHRRNYMVKSQLKSLEAKSKALNEGINSDTSIDEWAETYVARADAQIDDVSDYMQFRNLGNLAEKKTKLVRAPVRSNTNAIAPPSLHKWGAIPTHTMPDGTEMPGATHEGLDGWTDSLPQVGFGNTIGATGLLFLLGAGVGLVTYNEYSSSNNTLKSLQPRLKKAGMYGLIGLAVGTGYQALVGTGQQTGWY